MRLYRICPESYLENLSGLGGSYQDGARWNSPGCPVLYFALSASTALLEMANYIPSPRLIPPAYRLGVYELPEPNSVMELSPADLPADWAVFPHPRSTREIGDRWLQSPRASLVLIVPSAAVPGGLDKIAIVNPRHPECENIRLVRMVKDLYNERTFSGLDDR
jgi:RES domain-containing protein